jgi:septal ring factor EnvC (AmiA/AmiB activator)
MTAVIKVFEDKRTHTSKGVPFGSKSVYYLIPRVICAFLIIIWLTTGALLCGLIWPPQVREMLWDYFTPQKSSTDEDFWEGIIQDIKGIVKDQEAAKMSEENFSKMVTDMRAEMAKVVDKSDSVAAIINNCNDQIVDMIKQINQLLGKQEDGHH